MFEEVLEVLDGAVVAGTVVGVGGDAVRVESQDDFWRFLLACGASGARRGVAVQSDLWRLI